MRQPDTDADRDGDGVCVADCVAPAVCVWAVVAGDVLGFDAGTDDDRSDDGVAVTVRVCVVDTGGVLSLGAAAEDEVPALWASVDDAQPVSRPATASATGTPVSRRRSCGRLSRAGPVARTYSLTIGRTIAA